MGKPPCCDRTNVKRGLWTPEEDAKILTYVATHGSGNWTLVPKKAGLNRCGKSCRLRWTNYLRPDLKHDNFTPQEEQLIINLHEILGSRWSFIARSLPGRTDNDVKNYWNTKLRKKLQKMGIDPVTHKPFSQIFSDIGNIGGISNTGNQIGSFDKTMVTKLMPKTESSSVLTELSGSNMVLNPMTEQVQDNSTEINQLSFDFLCQFQLTNPETTQPHQFFNEVSSSCSSSSSNPFTQSQPETAPSSPYLWSEFLVNDPVLSMECQQQEESDFDGMFLPTNSSTLTQNGTFHRKFNNGCDQQDSRRAKDEAFKSYGHGGTDNGDQGNHYHADATNSSSASSFVESILDKDREMLSQFPHLLDPSFDY